MSTRRGFLTLLGLAAPAAVLAPKPSAILPPLPYREPSPALKGLVERGPPINESTHRYLGLAQLKNEGDPVGFDPGDPYFEDEISRFAKEAFGRKELYQWPDSDWEDEA
jgi:hypothetical protein